MNLTVSPFSTGKTRACTGESYLIIIENPTDSVSQSVESVLTVERISESVTVSTQSTLDGEVIASFVCDNGQIVEINVPEEYTSARGLRAWLQCVRSQYKNMMAVINGDSGASQIVDANNNLNGLPFVTEVQVAVSAGIWCATR